MGLDEVVLHREQVDEVVHREDLAEFGSVDVESRGPLDALQEDLGIREE